MLGSGSGTRTVHWFVDGAKLGQFGRYRLRSGADSAVLPFGPSSVGPLLLPSASRCELHDRRIARYVDRAGGEDCLEAVDVAGESRLVVAADDGGACGEEGVVLAGEVVDLSFHVSDGRARIDRLSVSSSTVR